MKKILIVLVMALLLSSCSSVVSQDEYQGILTACDKNGGVSFIKANTFLLQEVYCVDGAMFKIGSAGDIVK